MKLILNLLVLAFVALVVSSCDLTTIEIRKSEKSEAAEETSDVVTIWEYRDSDIERITTSERIERFHTDKKLIAYIVSITDYHPDGSIKMTLTADQMIIEETKKINTAIGNVVVERDDNILKTEKLIWNQQNDEISSPLEVTIVRGNNILRGSELISNIDFSFVELKKVTAEGRFDEEDFDW